MVFCSGLNMIMKHLGAKIQIIKPKLEARIANISTATVNFPGELTYAGMKVIHTAQNMSMLNVMNLASLKLSGSLRARKARMKHRRARNPI